MDKLLLVAVVALSTLGVATPAAAQEVVYRCLYPYGRDTDILASSAEDAMQKALTDTRRSTAAARRHGPPSKCISAAEFMGKRHQEIDAQEQDRQRRLAADSFRHCKGVPASYSQLPRGQAVYAVLNACVAPMSVDDLVFLSSATAALLEKCGRTPGSAGEQVVRFISFGMTAAQVPQSLNASIRGLSTLTEGQALAIAACDRQFTDRWVSGTKKYLSLSASGEGARFVDGCVEHYNGAWQREKCSCMAEALRFSFTSIHEKAYAPSVVQRALADGGLAVKQLVTMACGVAAY